MQNFKCSTLILLFALLIMDAAAAPASGTGLSRQALPIRHRTNRTSSNADFDEFWGVPGDNMLMNRGGFEDQNFPDDGGALMEHGALTEGGDMKTLELVGSEVTGDLWRMGNSNDGSDSLVFNNEDDFLPDSEDKANDEFVEPKMLLQPGEEINEDLKGPGYDWSVMGKVRRVTTQEPQEGNIHFVPEEDNETKPWEMRRRSSS